MDIFLKRKKNYTNPCSNCSTSKKNIKTIKSNNQINKTIMSNNYKNNTTIHFFPNLNQINNKK
jgi:hypothetical protein